MNLETRIAKLEAQHTASVRWESMSPEAQRRALVRMTDAELLNIVSGGRPISDEERP